MLTHSRHEEPEHRDQSFIWQIVWVHLSGHTESGLKPSGSTFYMPGTCNIYQLINK